MKATFQHADLSTALGRAMRATGKASGLLPILSHVAIYTEGIGGVIIVGSDSRQRIEALVPADVAEQPDSIALDGTLLAAFLGSTKGDEVTLTTTGTVAELRAGRAKAKIHGLDTEDVPSWPAATDGTTLTLDAVELRRAISLTGIAVAKEDSRPVLAGIHVTGDGADIQLASADGFRMSVTSIPTVDRHWESTSVNAIIPAPSLRTLAGLLPTEGTVDLALSERQAHATLDGVQWASVLIDGTFPDVRQIVPRTFQYQHTAERKPLASALKAAAPFAKDNNERIEIAANTGELEVVGIGASAGSFSYSVIASYANDLMPRTGLNAHYLADVLGALDGEEVTLSGNGASQALVITDPAHHEFTHVIMPMVVS